MKGTTVTLAVILLSLSLSSQDITGTWNGILDVKGMQLRLVFHITAAADGYTATMDSPDQGATGIPVSSVTWKDATLRLIVATAGISYEGVYGEDQMITGQFKQAGYTFPLNLSKAIVEKKERARPQTPQPPFPYYVEEVEFDNPGAGITLAGTLTTPDKAGKSPAVILISGSGPQNRDEEIMGHKPFHVLADYMTRNGIAVLRYDDRGTASSTGDFATATSEDFAADVKAAISFLKLREDIDPKHIGLIGHSEGGIIAPMVAVHSPDVAFIVLLAGTGIPGEHLLLMQQGLIAKAMGQSDEDIEQAQVNNALIFKMVVQSTDHDQLRRDLTTYLSELFDQVENVSLPEGFSMEQYIALQVEQVTSPWMQFFLRYDPAPTLEQVKCPVLALNGEKDLQVPPKENLRAIRAALEKGGNRDYITLELPGLNHLFQECETGSPDEYAVIEQTFSPAALEVIFKWIQQQVR